MSQSVLVNEHTTQEGHLVLELVLNVERTLHALNLDMIRLMNAALDHFLVKPKARAVLLTSTGEKAFCAGGDVVAMYHAIQQGDLAATHTYFQAEYQLDYRLHTLPVPMIGWGSGIVMGGGMGLLNGCSHRIVTQTSHLAMPEVTIGLYPDVAASWFLNRLPGRTGLFLALTGNPMNAADALYLGLADYYAPADQYDVLKQALLTADWRCADARGVVNDLFNAAAFIARKAPDEIDSVVERHRDQIEHVVAVDDMSVVLARLKALETNDAWLQRARHAATAGSPLSLMLIHEQLARYTHASLKTCLASELNLSVAICEQGDFAEGVRALLVDKDKTPVWKYQELGQISPDAIESFFTAAVDECVLD